MVSLCRRRFCFCCRCRRQGLWEVFHLVHQTDGPAVLATGRTCLELNHRRTQPLSRSLANPLSTFTLSLSF